MKRLVSAVVSAAITCTSIMASAPASAETPKRMRDLIGARGSSAESELSSRGYKFQRNLGSAALWWNSSERACVSVAVNNGRVASIETASATDCGKHKGGDLAGLAAGAAAVGLVAALSGHHSKTNDRNNHATYNGEYERGYNDAMYGAHYSNSDSEAYHSGYMAGEAERNNRRHANSNVARSVPAAAGNACISKGETEWGVYPGSVSVVSSSSYAPGNYEVVLATGHWRATCRVTANGQVTDFWPN